jgi:hypothetical protein
MHNFQFDTLYDNVYNWENEIYKFLRENFKKLYGEEK